MTVPIKGKGPAGTAEDEGADVRVENLVLDARSVKSASDPDLTASILDARVDLSMSAGVPMLDLVVLDPDRDLLGSRLLADSAVDVTLDRVPFRLVEADFDGIDALTLVFEHRLAAFGRSHRRPRKFSRGKFTRAEAIFALWREVKAMPFRFVAPELHKRQAIKKDDEDTSSRKSRDEKDRDREPGFADGVKLYGKSTSVPLTAGQVRNAERVLDVCREKNAGPKATLAVVEACIIEAPDFNNPTGGHSSSVGILQLLNTHLNGSTSTRGGRRDIELVVTLFLEKGFTGRGGAIKLARDNPQWTAGQIAQAVQGSAHPGRYDTVRKQAKDIVAAYGDVTGDESAPGTRKRYEFTRGQPGKREDTVEASQRLANEVRWRWFIAGAQTIYYASDSTLLKSRPRYLIDPTTVGLVGHPRGKVELGGRTVIERGRRVAKASECEITVRIERWAAGPGTVIEIADYGPYDGRWLVEAIDRAPYDAQGVVRLRQPQKPLREPDTQRNSRRQSDTTGGNGTAVGNGLTYPLASQGKSLGGVAAHKARAWGNWQSDNAVDIGINQGVDVYAVADGEIVKLGGSWRGGSANPDGYNVTLKTEGNTWFYTHLRSRVSLRVGQRVTAGTKFGESGAANGVPHLHIGCEKGDPERLLKVPGSAGAPKSKSQWPTSGPNS